SWIPKMQRTKCIYSLAPTHTKTHSLNEGTLDVALKSASSRWWSSALSTARVLGRARGRVVGGWCRALERAALSASARARAAGDARVLLMSRISRRACERGLGGSRTGLSMSRGLPRAREWRWQGLSMARNFPRPRAALVRGRADRCACGTMAKARYTRSTIIRPKWLEILRIDSSYLENHDFLIIPELPLLGGQILKELHVCRDISNNLQERKIDIYLREHIEKVFELTLFLCILQSTREGNQWSVGCTCFVQSLTVILLGVLLLDFLINNIFPFRNINPLTWLIIILNNYIFNYFICLWHLNTIIDFLTIPQDGDGVQVLGLAREFVFHLAPLDFPDGTPELPHLMGKVKNESWIPKMQRTKCIYSLAPTHTKTRSLNEGTLDVALKSASSRWWSSALSTARVLGRARGRVVGGWCRSLERVRGCGQQVIRGCSRC
ncbi:Unknown protein, partial [Striga hermonthica]